MNKVEKYLDSVYDDFDCKDKELQELKSEMRVHILEAIKELRTQGYTEDESINIAIENFGDSKELDSEISNVFTYKNNDYMFILSIMAIFMIILTIYTKVFSKQPDIEYNRVILPFILIPVYVIYKGITIFKYNKKSIDISIKYEFIKIITSLYIILLADYLIFPLDFTSGYMKNLFILIMPHNLSEVISYNIRSGLVFIPFGLLMTFNVKQNNLLIRIILNALAIFLGYCVIKFVYSLLGSELVAIRFYQIIGVIIGTTIGYLFYKIISKISKKTINT